MKKKLLSSCLVLSICAIAVAPIYNQLDLNRSSTVHSTTEWYAANSEKISAMQQQLGSTDYIVTYPQEEEKIEVLAARTTTPSPKVETTVKPIASTSTRKPATSTRKVAIKAKTTTASRKTVVSTSTSTKATSTTNTETNRGTSNISSSKVNAVISTAKSFLGVPYVWGGTTPIGFDCSGFTQYVLSKNGISAPRTAAEQYKVGISVSKINLRPGDLVFFTTYKAGASHLGFYLGNGDFIHCSSSKGVTISNLSNSYYASHYIGARRVIY